MPLCTLEISREHLNKLPKGTAKQTLVNTCEKALDVALPCLGVPDPTDREYRVLINEKLVIPKLSLSYTVGLDEYGTGDIFEPSYEQILQTRGLLETYARRGSLRGAIVSVKPWRDSTFLECSRDDSWYRSHSQRTPENRIMEDLKGACLSVIIAPETFSSMPIPKEYMGKNEGSHRFIRWIDKFQGVANLVKNVLNFPYHSRVGMNILEAYAAQTDVAVELDLPNTRKDTFLPEELLYLASAIENFINTTELTKEGSASVWIRQGQPDGDPL